METSNRFVPTNQSEKPVRRTNTIAAVAGVVLTLALIVIAAVLLLGRDDDPAPESAPVVDQEVEIPSDDAPESQPPPAKSDALPEVTEPTEQPAPEAEAVEETEEPETEETEETEEADSSAVEGVGFTFDHYVDGINRDQGLGTWDAYALLTAGNQVRVGGFNEFAESVSTSRLHQFDVEMLVTTGRSSIVSATFISTQEPDFGFDGNGCTKWSIEYTMILEVDEVWRIDAAKNRAGSPESCDLPKPDGDTGVACGLNRELGPSPLGHRAFLSIFHEDGDTNFVYEHFLVAGEGGAIRNEVHFANTSLGDARQIMRTDSSKFEELFDYPDPGGLYIEIDNLISCH